MLGYRNSYLLRHPGALLSRLWSEVRQFVGRHVRGYGWRDVANADAAIAQFALPLVRGVKDHGGTPMKFLVWDVDTGMPVNTLEESERARREWHEVLDAIIWSLDYVANDRDFEYGGDAADEARERHRHGMRLFAEHFRELWT